MTMFYIISGITILGIIYYISCYKSKEKKEAIKQRKEWNEIYGYHKNHGAEKND